MLRTLFFIPHEIASIPVFGWGWLLGILVVGCALRIWFAGREYNRYLKSSTGADDGNAPPSVAQVVASESMFWAIAAFAIVVVLPNVELTNTLGEPVGMAIRGYGVMLLCGVASAVYLAYWRTKRAGLDPEWIFGLAPWVLIGGIAGARLFFVNQYREDFVAETTTQTLKNMLAFTTGGLVVYGSFIGGFIAYLIFVYRNKIPVLRFGDAIIPCLFLGVFFGRIGCLFNGCCYGGRCEPDWASIRFPANNEVYHEQLRDGELLGMKIDPDTGKVQTVLDESVAQDLGIQPGQIYRAGRLVANPKADQMTQTPAEDVLPGWMFQIDEKTIVLSPEELPQRSLPVRAAQLISSVSALTLCLVLCGLSLVIARPGALICLGFAGYAIVRFGLEIVRVDEGGQFNTSLSISQWVSVVVFILSMLGLIWIYFLHTDSTGQSGDAPKMTGDPASGSAKLPS